MAEGSGTCAANRAVAEIREIRTRKKSWRGQGKETVLAAGSQ